MTHEVERAVDAGVAGAKELVLGHVREGVAGRVGVAEEVELDPLRAVVEDELIVKDDVWHFQLAFSDVLAAELSFTSVLELFRPADAQDPGAVGLGDDAGPDLAELVVAVGVVA